MAKELQDRSVMDPKYQWDLSTLYADDAAWEAAFAAIDEKLTAAPSFRGTLHTAEAIRGFFNAEMKADREFDNLATYASLRHSEDTRAEAAQDMLARVQAKMTRYFASVAFAEPEILSLPKDELEAITASPLLDDYRLILEDMLLVQPHTLSASEEELLAGMREVTGAPGRIANSLMDADLVFEPAADSEGVSHEVTGSNFILLQTSPDRTLRKNAFKSNILVINSKIR